ncbi:YdbH domain-containing protein [Candidatus Omnitrophota bacterium]
MKKVTYVLLAVALVLALAYALINPLIIFLVKRQLGATFSGSQVSLGGCRFTPARRLSLSEINIKRKQLYDFRIKTAEINYSLTALLRGEIINISLKQAGLSVNLPQQAVVELKQYLNLGPPGWLRINALELSDINLDFNTKDLTIQSVFSCRLDLAAQAIEYLDFQVESLGLAGVKLNNASLRAAQDLPAGNLDIGQLKYDKLQLTAIKGKTRLKGNRLSVEELSAQALNGAVQGELTVSIAQEIDYLLDLRFLNLDIESLVDDFNLKDKFEMSGSLSGSVAVQGRGARITVLGGDFSSDSPGGILIIKDKALLENLAGQTNESLDLLVENFKNYRYNTGTLRLSLEQNNLLLDVALDGDTGKRNLNITLHELNSK